MCVGIGAPASRAGVSRKFRGSFAEVLRKVSRKVSELFRGKFPGCFRKFWGEVSGALTADRRTVELGHARETEVVRAGGVEEQRPAQSQARVRTHVLFAVL